MTEQQDTNPERSAIRYVALIDSMYFTYRPASPKDYSALLTDPVRCVEMMDHVDHALSQLTAAEKQTLEQRFGLDGEDPRTLAEIGRDLPRARGGTGVTLERVRQIEIKALRKLRAPARWGLEGVNILQYHPYISDLTTQ